MQEVKTMKTKKMKEDLINLSRINKENKYQTTLKQYRRITTKKKNLKI